MFNTQEIPKKRTFFEHELEFHKKFFIIWNIWAILVVISNFSELSSNLSGIIITAALPGVMLWNHYKKYSEYSKEFNLHMEYVINKDKLEKSGDFILIKKFVEKNIDYLSTYLDTFKYKLGRGAILRYGEQADEGRIDPRILRLPFMSDDNIKYFVEYEEIPKLYQLLTNKGHIIKPNFLIEYIFEETEKQSYNIFKNKMTSIKTSNIDELIHTYLDMFWGEYLNKLDFFYMLIKEKGHSISYENLKNKIESKKKELELKTFERKLYSDDKTYIKISDMDTFTGKEFEDFLANLFIKLGYYVKNVKTSHDQGADLIIEKYGEKIVVQAKRYMNKVDNTAVQEVVASIKHYNADRGMVITTNEFTPSAIELAKSNNIELIDRKKLKDLLDRSYRQS